MVAKQPNLNWIFIIAGTLMQYDHLFDFSSLGSFLEFDLFGIECSHYQLNREVDMPSDAQRIHRLHQLIEEGYEDKLMISHDIHTKHRLVSLEIL